MSDPVRSSWLGGWRSVRVSVERRTGVPLPRRVSLALSASGNGKAGWLLLCGSWLCGGIWKSPRSGVAALRLAQTTTGMCVSHDRIAGSEFRCGRSPRGRRPYGGAVLKINRRVRQKATLAAAICRGGTQCAPEYGRLNTPQVLATVRRLPVNAALRANAAHRTCVHPGRRYPHRRRMPQQGASRTPGRLP